MDYLALHYGGGETTVKPDPDALIAKYGKGNTNGLPCTVGASGKRELIEALRGKGVQIQRIVVILEREFDLRISAGAMGRHLSQRCRCPR